MVMQRVGNINSLLFGYVCLVTLNNRNCLDAQKYSFSGCHAGIARLVAYGWVAVILRSSLVCE